MLALLVVLGEVVHAQAVHVRDPFGVWSEAGLAVSVTCHARKALAIVDGTHNTHRAGLPPGPGRS